MSHSTQRASDHATPLHAPLTPKVHDNLFKHNTKAVFISARFTVIVLTEKVLLTPPSLPWLFLTHTYRSWGMTTEMCWWGIYFPCSTAATCHGGAQKTSRKIKSFTINLTPFTPFKSPFSSESRVKITLWLRLWSCKKHSGVIMWLLSR